MSFPDFLPLLHTKKNTKNCLKCYFYLILGCSLLSELLYLKVKCVSEKHKHCGFVVLTTLCLFEQLDQGGL